MLLPSLFLAAGACFISTLGHGEPQCAVQLCEPSKQAATASRDESFGCTASKTSWPKLHNRVLTISVSEIVIGVYWWCQEFPCLKWHEPPRDLGYKYSPKTFYFDFISRFTKNLSPDKINLSTLKGEGQLSNLELDEEVLQNMLDLPTWLAVTRVYCNKAAIRVCF